MRADTLVSYLRGWYVRQVVTDGSRHHDAHTNTHTHAREIEQGQSMAQHGMA